MFFGMNITCSLSVITLDTLISVKVLTPALYSDYDSRLAQNEYYIEHLCPVSANHMLYRTEISNISIIIIFISETKLEHNA